MLYDLVRTEQMDPWDINVSLLTKKYITMLKELKGRDFRISGRVLLAAAILLKIKSNRLVGEDILQFDRLLSDEEPEEELYEETPEYIPREELGKPSLIPRVPQPRKRKVSIYDLVNALEKALEVKRRRVMHSIPPADIEIPEKQKDITKVIRALYGRIKTFLLQNNKNKLTFSQLVPSENKTDKIYTFVPLLHLSNQQRVELLQERHFGEIDIFLKTEKEVDKELGLSE